MKRARGRFIYSATYPCYTSTKITANTGSSHLKVGGERHLSLRLIVFLLRAETRKGENYHSNFGPDLDIFWYLQFKRSTHFVIKCKESRTSLFGETAPDRHIDRPNCNIFSEHFLCIPLHYYQVSLHYMTLYLAW